MSNTPRTISPMGNVHIGTQPGSFLEVSVPQPVIFLPVSSLVPSCPSTHVSVTLVTMSGKGQVLWFFSPASGLVCLLAESRLMVEPKYVR